MSAEDADLVDYEEEEPVDVSKETEAKESKK
jgi:hypothetical protein